MTQLLEDILCEARKAYDSITSNQDEYHCSQQEVSQAMWVHRGSDMRTLVFHNVSVTYSMHYL